MKTKPMRFLSWRLVSLGLLLLGAAAQADGLDALRAFLAEAQSGHASFTQTVSSPPREGQAPRIKTSTGDFLFQRPDRFRFDYDKPFVQHIVADGQTLWLHDVDLEQVTARSQAEALGQTPAALIAAAGDIQALQADFALEAEADDAQGLQWVRALPRVEDGALQQVRIGFEGSRLAELEILDSFGQRSRLRFENFELNPVLDPDRFRFQPPAGVDILRQ